MDTRFQLGWIKLHRCLTDWEWYSDINVRLTFIHFLIKANYQDKRWQGELIPRGSFITSIKHLSEEIGISKMQVRTAIKKLVLTNEITSESSNANTMITIVSYNTYQLDDKPNNKPITNKEQTDNKRITTTKEVKNIKEYKKLLLSELSVADVDNENYLLTAQAFQKLFRENITSGGGSASAIDKAKGTWYDDIRKMIEIDKIELEAIRKVFIFLKTDEFWKKNILSTSKLRDKFNKLILNANKPNGQVKRNITREQFEDSIDKHFN